MTVTAACILHAIRCDDEQRVFRHILNSCVLMDISNVMNCSADTRIIPMWASLAAGTQTENC